MHAAARRDLSSARRVRSGHRSSHLGTRHLQAVRRADLRCTMHQSIGKIQFNQGNLSAAGSDFQSALSEFEALGEQVGAAQCTRMLGAVRRCQGDYDSAKTLLTAALEALTRLGSRLDLANCHWSFGQLYRDQGRTREALASFESARDIYEALGRQATSPFATR
ncbi:hypothetical protein BKA62DRAFT_162280 [Auriculariales sp. MPI-PUGE-AT-0066]|nr:hypothetical protein BKA62DRAFT_162280 [Auriculariales sp. MPI-PUGE-AT-0066]